MKAQDIMPQYEVVVAEYDVKYLLCACCDSVGGMVTRLIVNGIAMHTSPKWARGVDNSVKEIVDGVINRDPEACGRIAKYCFVFDDKFFLGYDTERGVVLRRRA